MFPLELTTFSRPILAKTFSEGVIGNIIKNTRIIPVSRINPMQEAIVTFVDLFRFDINPDFLLILSPFFYRVCQHTLLSFFLHFIYYISFQSVCQVKIGDNYEKIFSIIAVLIGAATHKQLYAVLYSCNGTFFKP